MIYGFGLIQNETNVVHVIKLWAYNRVKEYLQNAHYDTELWATTIELQYQHYAVITFGWLLQWLQNIRKDVRLNIQSH